jgi:hypothetical protein
MFATPTVHQNGSQLHVSHGEDRNLFVEFAMEPLLDKLATEREGRPMYKDVPFITINFPGDKTKRIHRPIKAKGDESNPADSDRFPRQWAAFQNQQSQIPEGSRLEEWPVCTRSDVLNFKQFGIHTVEMLAALSDNQVQGLPLGTSQLRAKAQAFLEQAKDGAATAKYAKENADLKQDLDLAHGQIKDLAARLEALEKGEKKTLKLKENQNGN